jgi:hypothetical protein
MEGALENLWGLSKSCVISVFMVSLFPPLSKTAGPIAKEALPHDDKALSHIFYCIAGVKARKYRKMCSSWTF